jgi:acyl-CoA thioesterase-1
MRTIQMIATATVLAAAASTSSARGAPAVVRAAAEPVRIVALGDSLTSGHRLPSQDAYPALIQSALLDEGIPAVVINHGISGDTTAGGVRRVAAALAERPDVLILALGVNDGLRGLPVAQVRRNLETIIEAAQAQDVAVVLCAMEALPLQGWQYTVDFHQLYEELAQRYTLPLVPFIMLGVLGNPELMAADGVHPNAAGAKVLAANILPYVRPLVRSRATGVTTPDRR